MKLTREHNHIHLRWASMALALASCLLAIGVSWALAQPAETLEAAEEEASAAVLAEEVELQEESVLTSDAETNLGENDVSNGSVQTTENESIASFESASEADMSNKLEDSTVDDLQVLEGEERNWFSITCGSNMLKIKLKTRNGEPLMALTQDFEVPEASFYPLEYFAPKVSGDLVFQYATYKGSSEVRVQAIATNGYSDGTSGGGFSNFRLYSSKDNPSGGFFTIGNNADVSLVYDEPVEDKSGSYILVAPTNSEATQGLSPMPVHGSSNSLLGKETNLEWRDGEPYAAGGAVWTLEKNPDNTYCVYTTHGLSQKAYLDIQSGVINTTYTKKAVKLVVGTGEFEGKVRLVNTSGNPAVGLVGNEFGVSNTGGENEWFILAKQADYLQYDLRIGNGNVGAHPCALGGNPWMKKDGSDWKAAATPALPSDTQVLESGFGTLYGTEDIGEPGDDGLFVLKSNLSWQGVGLAEYMRSQGKSPGKAFRFDGWQATVDGVSWTFPPGAKVDVVEDGYAIEDMNGVARKLPQHTRLQAQWFEVSDIVEFFVGRDRVILNQEDDPICPKPSSYEGVSVGHIYHGESSVGEDGHFIKKTDGEIRAVFRPEYDRNNADTQIVVEYVSVHDGNRSYLANAPGANSAALDEAALLYIQKKPSTTLQLHVPDTTMQNRPAIEKENVTSENYAARWYWLFESQGGDGWHADGTLVAKTQQITLEKTFSGLSKQEIETLMGDTGPFSVKAKLGENKQDYLTITAADRPGVVSYDGLQVREPQEGLEPDVNAQGGTAHWTLNAILHEDYQFEEAGYTLSNYDVSSLVTHSYRDDAGMLQHESASGNSTAALKESHVVGGKTLAVTFSNFYTPAGTGAFTVVKNSSATGEVLSSAEFTLTRADESWNAIPDSKGVVATTNAKGSAYFSNLEPGRYILEETQPPAGFKASGEKWYVEVTKGADGNESDADSKASVVIHDSPDGADQGKIVFKDGAITEAYVISNDLANNTVSIVKEFKELSAAEMQDLRNRQGNDAFTVAIDKQIAEGEEAVHKELRLDEASVSHDGMTFTWTCELDEGMYTVTESNCQVAGYADVVVSVQANGEPLDGKNIKVVHENGGISASFEAEVLDQSSPDAIAGSDFNVMRIRNEYTNTFTWEFFKYDGGSGTQAPLGGAAFKVYGPYVESADPSDSIRYEDENGVSATYYLHNASSGNTGLTSNGQGIAQAEGLSLGQTYVAIESEAPAGYGKNRTVFVAAPDVSGNASAALEDGAHLAYSQGAFRTEVPNYELQTTSELPQAGGMGRVGFVIGGLLIAAIPMLAARRRFKQRG